ncbi:MAG: Smr/MutS family protein [Chromatiales bacterium]|nr:Smr/MutS family protein [Chromatiales bacterium]
MSKPVDPNDSELFANAMRDVRPLGHDRVRHARPRPAPRARERIADELRALDESRRDRPDPSGFDSPDELYFRRPGVDERLLRDLRRGRFRVQGELDLHGLTQAQARVRLAAFLLDASRYHWRAVRIIHGKGLGSFEGRAVLKARVDEWLRRIDSVLGFITAPRSDGGSGAVYVLLRSSSSGR